MKFSAFQFSLVLYYSTFQSCVLVIQQFGIQVVWWHGFLPMACTKKELDLGIIDFFKSLFILINCSLFYRYCKDRRFKYFIYSLFIANTRSLFHKVCEMSLCLFYFCNEIVSYCFHRSLFCFWNISFTNLN